MRTNDHRSSQRLMEFSSIPNQRFDVAQLFNATLGLSGEVGEFNDNVKKMLFHSKSFDERQLKRELGDVLWYVALICNTFHWELDEIARTNIHKLESRYPDGFDVMRANNREEGDV